MSYQQAVGMTQVMEQAWRLFMQDGVLDQNIVKSNIARSWQRCSKRKTDPVSIEAVSPEFVKQKQKKNWLLIDVSMAAMNDLFIMLKNNLQHFSVILVDSDGMVNYRINYGNEIVSPGQYCDETHTRTNGAALALLNGVGTEVSGYEHLRPDAHNWHTIGVPIRTSNKKIAGVLAILNADGPCPPLTMQTVSMAGYLIESRLHIRELLLTVSNAQMQGMHQATILADKEGTILGVNMPCLHLLQTTQENLMGTSIKNYLDIDYSSDLFSHATTSDGSFFVPVKHGSKKSSKAQQFCQINRRSIVLDDNNLAFMFTLKELPRQPRERLPARPDAFAGLIGSSTVFLRVIDMARKAAGMVSNILIEGESGTGKELMARAVHDQSGRAGKFIAINCGSIPPELLNSELFGYAEGAFTGAKKGGNVGKFELADGGTVFLDEIGEMPLAMQVALLRFLEDRTITRVGGSDTKTVDVRIIAATNRCLAQEVNKGNFREDLFYRLSVVNLNMPPLRERREDIPILAEVLLKQVGTRNKIDVKGYDAQVLAILSQYSWPGNIRQLQNVIESSLIQAGGDIIRTDALPGYLWTPSFNTRDRSGGNLKDLEYQLIQETLKKNNGNISKAALELGITRKTIYKKMKQMATN